MNTYIFVCDIHYGTEEQYQEYVVAPTLNEAVAIFKDKAESDDPDDAIDHIIKIDGTPEIRETMNYRSIYKHYPETTKFIRPLEAS